MLRSILLALAGCASIAAIALLASTAWAELPEHPSLQTLRPDQSDMGPDPEAREEPAFGRAVVIRDELAFIGMPARSPGGRVGVYTATPTELIRTGTLTPSDPVLFGSFGRSLAYRDGILVVGSNNAAYVFQRSNGVWTQRQKLTAPATDNVRSFADALRYENGTLAIGANTRSQFNLPGAVYIYERNATGKFIARGKLLSTDSSPNDGFGAAISTAGPVMVVGAPNIDAAYIFRRSDTGVWRQRQTLVASELARGFGTAVAIDRAMIIVGAPFVGEGESSPKGAAYGFTPGGGIYVETFKLQPRPDEVSDYVYFGRQIAMFDQRIVIGAQLLITDAPLNGVIVFTYTRAGSSVMARGVVGGAFASTSLSLANQRLLVGVPCSTSIQGLCLGKVDLYSLNVFE